MTNLNDFLVVSDKPVATKNILKENGSATLIKIQKGAMLDRHQSKTNALLVLLSGQVIYEEEQRAVSLAKPHDFVYIPEKVTHRVLGEEDSLLLLIH